MVMGGGSLGMDMVKVKTVKEYVKEHSFSFLKILWWQCTKVIRELGMETNKSQVLVGQKNKISEKIST